MNKSIHISVRELVEFVMKSGSIDFNYKSSVSMQDGTRIHSRLQKKRIKEAALGGYVYEKEMILSHEICLEDFVINIDGRADGMITSSEYLGIEEIKSTMRNVSDIEENFEHWHHGQAKCYAYIAAYNAKVESIKVIVTYCHVETEQLVSFDRFYSFEELEEFFLGLVKEYFAWAKHNFTRMEQRNESLNALKFPFEEYRSGQRAFAVSVYNTIKKSRKIFAEAPTGTGKTISTLFPSVKAMGEGFTDKIFYLTAKTITRQAAEEAVALMNTKNAGLISLTLTAKEKICLCDKMVCTPEHCIYAAGHFDRVNAAVWDIWTSSLCKQINRDMIVEYAKKHTVCPHEFTLDISFWVDVIICDYNYVFDPKVYLRRFFYDDAKEKYLFLVDEAHNLVDRAREMFSSRLTRYEFLYLKKEIKAYNKNISKQCDKIGKCLAELKKNELQESKACVKEAYPYDLFLMVQDLVGLIDEHNADKRKEIILLPPETETSFLNTYFNCLDYIRTTEGFNEKFAFYIEDTREGISVKNLCLDPSELLRKVCDFAVSTIFFSATLTPLRFFRDVFGGDNMDFKLKMPSPFPRENLGLMVCDKISTKYTHRASSYALIADCLYEMIAAKKGNYLAFFPSYEYLNNVYNIFMEICTTCEVLIQSQNMTEEAREEFLQNFTVDREKSLLAFAVMGGIFSEGIDLQGERLIGVCVITVGIPMITPERNAISNYYAHTELEASGYEYAYMFPGMNKVLQSAGRVIRTMTDRGVVLLIDSRFTDNSYQQLFPDEWEGFKTVSDSEDIKSFLIDFWR